MKTTKDLDIRIGRRPNLTSTDVYAKSLGKAPLHKNLHEPLHHKMYE